MASPRHSAAARRRDWPATECTGFVRRIFVRPGGERYYVPVGWMCDDCGSSELDEDRADAIELAKSKAPWRAAA